MQHCHAYGVAHRDVKPDNILIGADYDLKLADFGCASPLTGWDGSGTMRGLAGTPEYCAPEILEGHPYAFQ